jgi:hypothetical protein
MPVLAGARAAETDMGLLVRTEGPRPDEPLTALVDPEDGRRLASYPVVHGVAGDLVLWGEEELDQGPFTLTDRRTGVGQRIPRPSRVGEAAGRLLSPEGRLLAVEAGDPAWTGDGRPLLLGRFDGVGDALAAWRPGQDRLAVRRLRLPADRAGSDSFVPRPRPPH